MPPLAKVVYIMGLVSVITVNYQQAALTVDFLRSLSANVLGVPFEVIVIENRSETDNGLLFEMACPGVIYLRSEKNLGFAGGNNLGIRHAKGDYLLFLNNDTEITPGFIGALRDELDGRPDIGLLSPLILYYEDKESIQYAGYTPMNYLTGRNKGIGSGEENVGQYDHVTTETGYCHGAAMMCRRKDLERVGPMSEDFFLYYEELDWCEKFKQAGFKVGFTGKAKIYHKESMSVGKESPTKTYYMVRNRWLFIRKNATSIKRLFFSFYYLFLVVPLLVARYLITGNPPLANAALRGIWWHINK